MQQVVKPVISAKSLDADKKRQESVAKKPVSELGPIQRDRSFLPKSSEQPVHKCGCT